MKVFVAIQARSDSKRLPEKIFKTIGPKSLLRWSYDAAQESCKILRNDLQIEATAKIVGTKDDLKLKEYCKKEKIAPELFDVDPNDVFLRLKMGFKAPYTHFVRLTADCWRLDPWLIAACVDLMRTQNLDYVSNTIFRTFEEGKDIQACSLKGFNWLYLHQKEQREHPFLDFDMNKKVRDEFEKDGLKYSCFTNSRLCFLVKGSSIDTEEDLEIANELYEKEYKK